MRDERVACHVSKAFRVDSDLEALEHWQRAVSHRSKAALALVQAVRSCRPGEGKKLVRRARSRIVWTDEVIRQIGEVLAAASAEAGGLEVHAAAEIPCRWLSAGRLCCALCTMETGDDRAARALRPPADGGAGDPSRRVRATRQGRARSTAARPGGAERPLFTREGRIHPSGC